MISYIQNVLDGKDIDLDPENVEYILRARVNFSTADLERYPFDRGFRMAKRALADFYLSRIDTYLRPLAESMSHSTKQHALKQQERGHHRVTLPPTWKKESVLKRS